MGSAERLAKKLDRQANVSLIEELDRSGFIDALYR
jgi:hypothetical protein